MQKVEGSSPFIRFGKALETGLSAVYIAGDVGDRKRKCKRRPRGRGRCRVSNGTTSPISIAIADAAVRAAVEEALDALARVHDIPATAAPVTVMSDALAHGYAAGFRVMNDACENAVDPRQSNIP